MERLRNRLVLCTLLWLDALVASSLRATVWSASSDAILTPGGAPGSKDGRNTVEVEANGSVYGLFSVVESSLEVRCVAHT